MSKPNELNPADLKAENVWAIFGHGLPGGMIHAMLGKHVDDGKEAGLSIADASVLPEWRKPDGYKRHLIDASELFKKEYGPSHLLVLEGPKTEEVSSPVMIGDVKIEGPFVIIGHDAKTGTDRYLHCVSCCLTVIEYIATMQEEWLIGKPETGATHVAPSRLQ